jgi:2-amino-4-hydroxy-6-hydroxymethyldihydropteridine diphosphokinase
MKSPDDLVVIAAGSNLAGNHGSCQALLEAAMDRFPAFGLTPLQRSRWWRSSAWPDPTHPGYLNGVVLVATTLAPREALRALLDLELAFGRRRGAANGPRTLDLDLIAHGRCIVREADLILPHPRAHDRLFVMGPLAEIAPGWRHPVSGATAEALTRGASVGLDARPVTPRA